MAISSCSASQPVQLAWIRVSTCTAFRLVHVLVAVPCGYLPKLTDADFLQRQVLAYGGHCGNGIEESNKVFLARNMLTRSLAVVASENIEDGEVIGQYLGELEHVSAVRVNRPRNNGYRLVMTQRPEVPAHPVRIAINAEHMGGVMRFVNHSCRPAARFAVVANGRRTTVVVVTTRGIRHGEEISVDYGDDLWFVCRCGLDTCRHGGIQDQEDP
ncbi:hypothetical protein PHYSODRAFT_526976 [Phytophthora sojae]|uniref:SET domain-containing protein n=1 Tax=Phytophthora sojae (strain P6497) TaxID=1094619 RepID=G5A809_PHYSP|nr:hypothetical protein PHYSODRAFT_526976 [Phytophthora sojae]EGZ08035.1 hypothetical protein PHYSODRAFT_526976 [Phytophthora sojae]|eukprot:XP_009536207.1 hypothetical protein PHYSODRAFT_526976 [Phytophthora sojae]